MQRQRTANVQSRPAMGPTPKKKPRTKPPSKPPAERSTAVDMEVLEEPEEDVEASSATPSNASQKQRQHPPHISQELANLVAMETGSITEATDLLAEALTEPSQTPATQRMPSARHGAASGANQPPEANPEAASSSSAPKAAR